MELLLLLYAMLAGLAGLSTGAQAVAQPQGIALAQGTATFAGGAASGALGQAARRAAALRALAVRQAPSADSLDVRQVAFDLPIIVLADHGRLTPERRRE